MLLFGDLCAALEAEFDGFDVAAVNSGMERDIALGIVEGDHFFAGATARFTPLEEDFQSFGRGVLCGLVNGVVTVVAGFSRASVELGDLEGPKETLLMGSRI